MVSTESKSVNRKFSLVFSESGRLSFVNGIDATHKIELNIRRVLH